jgi:hypothetical protein
VKENEVHFMGVMLNNIINELERVAPLELAEEFWRMDGQEQALVFNNLGYIAGSKFDFQCEYIADHLNDYGTRVIRALADRL